MSNGGVVTFDYDRWALRYPAFVPSYPIDKAQALFDDICTAGFLDNTACSPVSDLSQREALLWMLMCHIATLAKNPLVGRINTATEGSVSVGTDYGTPGSGKWFEQTQCGAMFWQATKRLRLGRYVPTRQGIVNNAIGWPYGRTWQ
jgi:Protein of unknown function (DUF4054)